MDFFQYESRKKVPGPILNCKKNLNMLFTVMFMEWHTDVIKRQTFTNRFGWSVSQPWKMDTNVLEVAATPELGISSPPDLLCPHWLSLIVFCLSYRVVPQQEKGSLREALSNNDQPVDLRTVTLSFHTQCKTVIMGGERGRAPGRAGNAIYKNRSSLFSIFHK